MRSGEVPGACEAGRILLKAGVITGGDMTPEVSRPQRTCFERLEADVLCTYWIILLLKTSLSAAKVRDHMSTALHGGLAGSLLQHTQRSPYKKLWTGELEKSRESCARRQIFQRHSVVPALSLVTANSVEDYPSP